MIDFVIVAYRSTRETGRLLLQLSLTFTEPHTVTVVDNTDENRGFAKATNIGARQGRGEIIAFLNPDLVLCEGWADETLEAMRADRKLVIAGPRLDDGMSWPRNLESVGLKNWVCGAAFFVRRDFFESVGGFDERFYFSHEESDLCRQAEAKGLRVETVGEPRVLHDRHATDFHAEQFKIARERYIKKWRR